VQLGQLRQPREVETRDTLGAEPLVAVDAQRRELRELCQAHVEDGRL